MYYDGNNYLKIENGVYHAKFNNEHFLNYESSINVPDLDLLQNYTIEISFTYLPYSIPVKDNIYGQFGFLYNFNTIPYWTGYGLIIGKYSDTAKPLYGTYHYNGDYGNWINHEEINTLYQNGVNYNNLLIITEGAYTQFILNNVVLGSVSKIDLQNKLGFLFSLGEFKVDYFKVIQN